MESSKATELLVSNVNDMFVEGFPFGRRALEKKESVSSEEGGDKVPLRRFHSFRKSLGIRNVLKRSKSSEPTSGTFLIKLLSTIYSNLDTYVYHVIIKENKNKI